MRFSESVYGQKYPTDEIWKTDAVKVIQLDQTVFTGFCEGCLPPPLRLTCRHPALFCWASSEAEPCGPPPWAPLPSGFSLKGLRSTWVRGRTGRSEYRGLGLHPCGDTAPVGRLWSLVSHTAPSLHPISFQPVQPWARPCPCSFPGACPHFYWTFLTLPLSEYALFPTGSWLIPGLSQTFIIPATFLFNFISKKTVKNSFFRLFPTSSCKGKFLFNSLTQSL